MCVPAANGGTDLPLVRSSENGKLTSRGGVEVSEDDDGVAAVEEVFTVDSYDLVYKVYEHTCNTRSKPDGVSSHFAASAGGAAVNTTSPINTNSAPVNTAPCARRRLHLVDFLYMSLHPSSSV